MQKRDGLITRHHQQTVGLRPPGGKLCDELRGGRADAAHKTCLVSHALAQQGRDLDRAADDLARSCDIKEGLIDSQSLDLRGQVVEDREDLPRVVLVSLEVRLEHYGL